MAFNATYDESDLTEATVNTIVKGILTVGTLIVVIVVVSLYVWLKKKI